MVMLLSSAAWAEMPLAPLQPDNRVSAEAVISSALTLDAAQTGHLLYVSYNKDLNRYRLCYTALPTAETKVLFTSQDEITRLNLTAGPPSVLATWQTSYEGRATGSYYTVTLDQGKHFGPVRLYSPSAGFAPPPAPDLISPPDGAISNQVSPEIRCRTNSAEPLLVRLELAWNSAFPAGQTWSFDALVLPASAETVFRPPLTLPDGTYYWRLTASNGLTPGAATRTASFEIDSRPPLISLTSPTGEVSDDRQVLISGEVSEPAKVTLNGAPLSVEAGGRFSGSWRLASGRNTLEVIAADKAGNQGRSSRTITYQAGVPHFKLTRPKPGDWFKPASTFYFEAEISAQNAVADETEGDLLVDGRPLADRPVYDAASQKLGGFLTLPPQLADGPHTATVRLCDQAGSQGGKNFTLNIDSSPPALLVASGEAFYSGSAERITLPLKDGGSGLDPQGTLVTLNGRSLEVAVSGAAGPAIQLPYPVADGSYEVWLAARDQVGNTAEAKTVRLIVDTRPPALFVNCAADLTTDRRQLALSGEASDLYLSAVNIYSGKRTVSCAVTGDGKFCATLPLAAGLNQVRIEAADRAGNKTSRNLNVTAELAAAALISKLAAGPSPYSPPRDGNLHFTFSFTAAPDELKLYIFDLTGTLIWQKSLPHFAGASYPWDGRNLFGQPVVNGVYPYLAQVTAGGETEIRRGKIIVLQ